MRWKLARVVQGRVGAELLDTYETERRPAAERVLMHSRVQLALIRPGPEVTAVRELFAELLDDPANVRRLGDLVSGADVRLPTEPHVHSLVGHWVPDITIETPTGAARLAELGRDGRPLLLDLTGNGALATARRNADGITVAAGRPVESVAATALLVRPDGYVAWASSSEVPDTQMLDRTLLYWFGITSLGSQGASSIPV